MIGHTIGRWLPAILWAAAIFWLSSQSELPRADRPLLDLLLKKGAHALGYAVLAVLVQRALGGGVVADPRWRAVAAWLLATLYAASDEWHQSLVPGRTAAALDVLIDSAGAAVGLLAQWRIAARYGAPSTDEPAERSCAPER